MDKIQIMLNNELSKGYKMNNPSQNEMKIMEEIMALKFQIEQLNLAIDHIPKQVLSAILSCDLLSINIKDQHVTPSSNSQCSDIEILNTISEPFEELEIEDRSSSNLPANYYETDFYLHWKKNFDKTDKKIDKIKWLYDGYLAAERATNLNQTTKIMPYNKELDLNFWLK